MLFHTYPEMILLLHCKIKVWSQSHVYACTSDHNNYLTQYHIIIIIPSKIFQFVFDFTEYPFEWKSSCNSVMEDEVMMCVCGIHDFYVSNFYYRELSYRSFFLLCKGATYNIR